MRKLIIGVDGGKSKTACLAAETGGRVVGWGRSGSSDKYDVPLDRALEAVASSVHQALQQANAGSEEVTAGCFGLAGADWPEDFAELEAGLQEYNLADWILVKNDAQIALRANADSGVGVVISGGTHLAAAIRTPSGQEWHSAWFSVEGAGGVTLGRQVLWAVLKAYDGRGQATTLTELVLAATGASHPLELLHALSAGQYDDAFFASLTPYLFQAHSQTGDRVAAEMIAEAGQDMSRWATGLLKRYELLNEEMPVILTGGLFKSGSELLLDSLKMGIHFQAPKAKVVPAHRQSVIGALAYACELAGQPVTPELLDAFQESAPGSEVFRTDDKHRKS